MKKEAAFSGLEAAIVLIAFVVVAAVFSYVMLGAGFFATQKSQEVTYSGIKQSTSNLVLDGMVYGVKSTVGSLGGLTKISFYLSIPEGGQPQNLKASNLRYRWTVNTRWEGTMGPVFANAENAATLATTVLRPGEKQEIILTIPRNLNGIKVRPRPGDGFTLEILPNTGAATLISKTLVTGYGGGEII